MTARQKKLLFRILAALVIFVILFALDRMHILTEKYDRYLLYCFLVPYLIAGWDVLRKAVLGLIHGRMLDEAFLMAIASIGAFVTGQYEEAAAVMIFYQIGEWFQGYAVGRSRKSIADLMDIVPEYANLEDEDGNVEQVDPDDVEIGSVLVIRPGEKIPLDGEVISGDSMINTAALTGESVPRAVHPGAPIISGCINGEGLLRIRTTKEFEDSTVAKILELVETASEKKSRTENFITRFARVYTPAVVAAAAALFVIPGLVTGQWMTWLYRACTFLVISCPCALVISVPLAFFGGIGAASRSGVLVKGSNFLELMAKVHTIVTDKTGTLTEGNFKVSALIPAEGVNQEELLLAAAQAEGMSTHPIAVSIREELLQLMPDAQRLLKTADDTDNISGQGLITVVDGKRICVGNDKLMQAEGIAFAPAEDPAATISYVAADGRYLGAILIRDTVKADASQAVRKMKESGVSRVIMLTGDRQAVGEAVAAEIGLDGVRAELMPQQKVEAVEELLGELSDRQKLAYIGDGINDAPVLSRADVGIAMGSLGSDAAIEAADIVIMDDDLMHISTVTGIARRTIRIARQNIVLALAVKLIVLVLGAAGAANMWAAVFADVGVCVICILNSMRLLINRK